MFTDGKKNADLHDIFVALLPSSGGFTPFRKLNVEAKAHKKTGVTPHMPLCGKNESVFFSVLSGINYWTVHSGQEYL